MNTIHPKLESEKKEYYENEIKKLIPYYTNNWEPTSDDDLGIVLIKLYSNIVEIMNSKLNKIPQKNFIEFLNTMQLKLLPPNAAQAPITIEPKKEIENKVIIPKGTKISSEQLADGKPAIFETDSTFLSTKSKMMELFQWYQRYDEIYNFSEEYNTKEQFSIFEHIPEKNIQEHIMYLGHETLFTVRARSLITVRFYSDISELEALETIIKDETLSKWEFVSIDDKTKAEIFYHLPVTRVESGTHDGTSYLDVDLWFPKYSGEIKDVEINKIKSKWIRLKLIDPEEFKTEELGKIKLRQFLSQHFKDITIDTIYKIYHIIKKNCNHCNQPSSKTIEALIAEDTTIYLEQQNPMAEPFEQEEWIQIKNCNNLFLEKKQELAQQKKYLNCFKIPEIIKICAKVTPYCIEEPEKENCCDYYNWCCMEKIESQPQPISHPPVKSKPHYKIQVTEYKKILEKIECIKKTITKITGIPIDKYYTTIIDEVDAFVDIYLKLQVCSNDLCEKFSKIRTLKNTSNNSMTLLSKQLGSFTNSNHLFSKKIKSLKNQQRNIESQLETSRQDLEEKENLNQDKRDKRNTEKSQLNKFNKNIKNNKNALRNLENGQKEIKKSITEKNTTKKELTHNVQLKNNELKELESTLNQIHAEREQINQPSLKEIQRNTNIVDIKNEIGKLSNDFIAQKSQKAIYERNFQNIISQINQMQKRITEYETVYDSLIRELELLENQNLIAEHKKQLSQLLKTIENTSSTIRKLEKNKSTITNKIQDKETEINKLSNIINKKNKKLNKWTNDVNKLIIERQTKAQNHKQDLHNKTTLSIISISTNLKHGNEMLESVQTDLEELNKSLSETNLKITVRKDNAVILQSQKDQTAEKITRLDQEIKTIKNEIAGITTSVNSLKSQLEHVETQLENMSAIANGDDNIFSNLTLHKEELYEFDKNDLEREYDEYQYNSYTKYDNLSKYSSQLKELSENFSHSKKSLTVPQEYVNFEKTPSTINLDEIEYGTRILCEKLDSAIEKINIIKKDLPGIPYRLKLWDKHKIFTKIRESSDKEVERITSRLKHNVKTISKINEKITGLQDIEEFRHSSEEIKKLNDNVTKTYDGLSKEIKDVKILVPEFDQLNNKTTSNKINSRISTFFNESKNYCGCIAEAEECKKWIYEWYEQTKQKITTDTHNPPQIDNEPIQYDPPDNPIISTGESEDCCTDRLPNYLFYNTKAIDPSNSFYPFGTRPFTNDIFYIGDDEAFSKKCNKLTISINYDSTIHPKRLRLHDNNSSDGIEPILIWEYFDGENWRKLDEPKLDLNLCGDYEQKLIINIPCDIKKTIVNNQESYWIRIRISENDFGNEKYEVTEDASTSPHKYTFEKIEPEYPPFIEKFSISFTSELEEIPSCVTLNNLDYKTHLLNNQIPFKPFELFDDSKTSIFLGFDQVIPEGPISIYFDIHEFFVKYPEILTVEFCYFSDSWKKLQVTDNTDGLTKSGTIKLLIPKDFDKCSKFGQELYWIKISNNNQNLYPRTINGAYLNTVIAHNYEKIGGELLGSGDDFPNQSLSTERIPIFEHPTSVWVKENDLSETDHLQLKKLDQIRDVFDDENHLQETWVCWKETEHLNNSDYPNRQYLIDKTMKSISFGNGKNGKILPEGSNNVLIDYYTGGGKRGNLPREKINTSIQNIPFVDEIFNPLPSDGGNDAEKIEELMIRGPHSISNRNQPIKPKDFEWIIREQFRSVHKVSCFSTMTPDGIRSGGHVLVVFIPFSIEKKPLPTLMLQESIYKTLISKCIATIDPNHLHVLPPEYIKINISGNIVSKNIEDIPIIEKSVKEKLNKFLHPIRGGHNNTGWEFDQIVCLADIYQVLESIPEIDHVDDIVITGVYDDSRNNAFTIKDNHQEITRRLPHSLIYGGQYSFEIGGKS